MDDRVVTPEEIARWDEVRAEQRAGNEVPEAPPQLPTDIIAHEDGSITANTSQDVEPILDACKERAAAGFGRSPSNELHELAHFPEVLVQKYCAERGIDFREFMVNPAHIKNMLSDPALSYFRVLANNPHGTFR